MTLVLADYGDFLNGHLCGVAGFDHETGVRVDESAACDASEESSRHSGSGITEGMTDVEFLTERVALAAGTTELPIEGFESFCFSGKFVLVSFDKLPYKLGVHLFDDIHGGGL